MKPFCSKELAPDLSSLEAALEEIDWIYLSGINRMEFSPVQTLVLLKTSGIFSAAHFSHFLK